MSQLDQVLARIDADLDTSLERLFGWLKIPSISTDPAYKDDCRTAGQWLVDELKGFGIDASLRETGGHPAVVGHAKGEAKPHVLFYGHYDVQPVDPLDLWEAPPFEPRMATLPDGRKVISARGSSDDKGQVHDLRRGLPGLEGGDRFAARSTSPSWSKAPRKTARSSCRNSSRPTRMS